MEKHSKRWLMSRLKTSGSKRKYIQNGNFAEERNQKKKFSFEELPNREPIKTTRRVYNGKIHYGLLIRFMRTQIGNNWDDVYAEIINRIPAKLLDYREIIFWFVANEVEFVGGKLWDRKKQKFIWTGELNKGVTDSNYWSNYVLYEFYVDPDTNLMQHIQQKTFRKRNII